ncbi:Spectrin beta chain, non-erythrocytic 5 [Tyrophagus putrescentiae]|nr:Spectrin beta chain, non-erythrocytic 5 [Tyrophagus putrescentiae]
MSFNDDDGDGAFICDNEKFERLRIGRLRTDRETIQAKTYKNWINSVLIKARTSIDDIYTDLADGQKLLLLLELITGEKIAEPSRGSSVLHKIENVSRCLKFIRSKDVYLESIGPEDIVNGNKRLTLGLIWTIILRFQLSQHLDFVQFDLKTIKDSLLLWCQSKTSKSTKCRVRDFKRSWSDGWAFVELVRSFRPDLIDPASMSKCSSVQMLDKAFDVANQHLMIPSILDAEDVATSADENSILTYISYFYNLYCRNKTTGTGSKRIKFIITQLSEVQSIQSSYEAQVSELMAWIKERTAHFASDIDINEAQEKMSQFNNYFWTERPEKLKARNDAESLYLDIANMHKKRGLRPFVPKANLSVKDLEKAWQHLEEVERRRQSQLKEKIVKYEQLTQAMDEFDLKCLKLENYISEKMALLNQIYEWKSTDSDDQSTNLSSLEVYLKQSELICCDIVSNSAKFDSIFKLTNQLIEHRYKNYEFVKMCCRHLKAKLKNLTDMAVRNQRTIDSTTKTIHYLKRLDCVKVELEQLTANLTLLPHNRTDSVQNVFSNLEKCKQYETELRLLERQFLVVQSRLFLLTDNNNHQSSVLIEPTLFQQRLSLIRSSLDQCRRLLEQHITSNHQNLDYNEFSEEIEYLQMFFSEKTILCQSSLDVCYDSTSIFSLQQRHNIIKLEVRTVEKQFFAACEKGYRLMAKANYYNPLVNEPIEQTKLSLRRLMRLVNERTYLINDSIQLIRLVDQLGEMHLLKGEDIHQTVTNCLREADEMGQLELTELSELLERINGLSSVHSLPHDIHCRLLRVVTDNFRAAQQLLTATAVDVDEDRLRRLLLPERKTQADSAGNDNCHRNDDDEDERLRSLPSTCANLNLQETERMVDLFLSGDNRLEHFIGSLQERQAMTQSDMASMNELMAFVRHTLQLLKVTQTFTRTFVQVKTDQQRHSRHFHKLRRSQAQSSIAPADDPSDDKTTSTPPLQLTPTSPDYQSKLNPEAFKFKVVTYKLQQNLNFIGNYLGTVNDDNATALAFKLNFSSDLIRKNFAQLSQLLTAEENLASLELRQEAEKTAALIDSVVQNETLMGGKVATLQRLEAVEDFFQTMADSVKQIGQIRPDADQVTVRRHVRQMKTMTVTLQSHFEELVNGASSLNEHHTADYNDVKLYESRITNLKHQFTQFQKVISQKSELCRQRLEQLTPDKIQISKMTTLNQQKRETSDSNRVDDQQFDSVTITEANQVPKNRKSAPEQTQKDDLESQLSIAELVLFEMESAGGSVSQSKFAETMAICDNALLNNPLTANDDSLIQRIDNLKNQLTRAWNNQMKQNEMKQFNLLSTEFMTTCKQKIETVKSLHYESQEIANCKQMVVQLQLDQRAIYEQFRLNNSSQKQSIYSQQPESSTSTDIDHNEPISSKSPISTMEFLHPFTSSTTLTLPPLVENIQPESSDDHLTTAETTPAELVSPEVEMSTEFDTKASGRVGTRSSLESDFSADYLLSVKDFGSMQTSSEENFANNLTESTLSLYYSESDSGHCELNYNINSSESRGDHQTGVCTECQQSTDPNKHPPLAVGTSQQTISSSYASLPINATEYIESSDDHKESESEHSEEPEHVTTSNDRQLETDCQTAQQMCTDMWTTVESAFEKINNLIVKKNYSANQQTQQLLNDISFAISNRQQEEEMFVSLNESTQSISNRVSNMLNTLSHSSRQLKYLVDHELQSLSDLTSKIEGADFSYELLADELDDRGNDKEAPLAKQEDSWMPSEEVNLTQNYVLSKSHQIDFTSTDFESFARGESSLSFASDIESSLHVDESIHPQLEGLEEKVDGIKSELEDIAARIAKHSDGKRLSFEVGNFDEMFEFKGLNSPVPHTEKVLNKSDSIDGSKIENSLPLFDNNNEVCLNDKNSSEISKTPQLETQIENSDLQMFFNLPTQMP